MMGNTPLKHICSTFEAADHIFASFKCFRERAGMTLQPFKVMQATKMLLDWGTSLPLLFFSQEFKLFFPVLQEHVEASHCQLLPFIIMSGSSSHDTDRKGPAKAGCNVVHPRGNIFLWITKVVPCFPTCLWVDIIYFPT